MHYKTLIVDDERLARKELRTLLRAHEVVDVVGEASSTKEAIAFMNQTPPDVVFLDIHMPGETGFDLIHRVSTQPQYIFVTAYDVHAVKAFDMEAIDYLLKPVRPDRLSQAISRLKPINASDNLKTSEPRADRIYLSDRGQMYLVLLDDIQHISGANDYSEVMSMTHGSILDTRTLGMWESLLPTDRFVRIHRSTIVNLDQVDRIVRDAKSTYLIYLKDRAMQPLKMSRRYAARLKDQFSLNAL
ncbi:MAG: LytTR family DNA-binding domain-containing protein [Rhodothermaceae bacterium]|nr:LytTR family DNA-binding domain-containing protein [Rhodothermaceae bacterium]